MSIGDVTTHANDRYLARLRSLNAGCFGLLYWTPFVGV